MERKLFFSPSSRNISTLTCLTRSPLSASCKAFFFFHIKNKCKRGKNSNGRRTRRRKEREKWGGKFVIELKWCYDSESKPQSSSRKVLLEVGWVRIKADFYMVLITTSMMLGQHFIAHMQVNIIRRLSLDCCGMMMMQSHHCNSTRSM